MRNALRTALLVLGLLGVASVAYPQAATWQVGNFMETTLSANITSGALTIGVVSIPTNLSTMTVSTSSAVYAVLEQGTRTSPTRQEVVRVTAVSGLNLTVTRGQDGTTAQAFNAGDRVSFRLVRYIVHDLRNRANSLDARASTLETGSTTIAAAAFVTTRYTGALANERRLTAGTGVTITDNGPNSTVTVAATPSIPLGQGYSSNTRYPVGYQQQTNTGNLSPTSGTSYAYYLGRADAAYTSATLQWAHTVNAATITWAEFAIASGSLVAGSNATLTSRGFTSVSGVITAGAVALHTTSITLTGVTVGMELWVVYGISAVTPGSLRAPGMTDPVGVGFVQTAAVRPQSMSATAFTVSTTDVHLNIGVTLQ